MLRFLSLPLVSPTFEGLSSKAVTVMCPSRGGGEQGERGTQGGGGAGGRKLLQAAAFPLILFFFFPQVWWSVTVKARENTVRLCFPFSPPPAHPSHPRPPPRPHLTPEPSNRFQECSERHIPAIAEESRASRAPLTQRAGSI